MATCSETGLSLSYAYKRGCRCKDCCELKSQYTKKEAPKARLRVKAWYLAHKGKKLEYERRYVNKKWLNTYGELCRSQNNLCAICFKPTHGMTSSSFRLAVDHDHKTGKIRGLLCGNCNIGLGHFKDSIQFLQQAIIYLKTSENGDVE